MTRNLSRRRYVRGQANELAREGERLQAQDGPLRVVLPSAHKLDELLKLYGFERVDDRVECVTCCQAWRSPQRISPKTVLFLADHERGHAKAT